MTFGIAEHSDTFTNDNHGILNLINMKNDFIDDRNRCHGTTRCGTASIQAIVSVSYAILHGSSTQASGIQSTT